MLQAIELGIPELLLFLTIIVLVFLRVERYYWQEKQSRGKIQFSIRSFYEQH